MDWYEQVKAKQKRRNEILFDRKNELLQPLRLLIAQQNHIVIVAWCLDCLQSIAASLTEKWGEDARISNVLSLSQQWARGEIKMPKAKAAILAVHAIAKETKDPIVIAYAHAIGQGCGSIHTEAHAIGMVTYDLTAMVHQYGIENCQTVIEKRVEWYMQRLYDISMQEDLLKQPWASFLRKDRMNAEAKIIQKMLSLNKEENEKV